MCELRSTQSLGGAHLAIGFNGTNTVTRIDLVSAVVASF